MFGKIMNTRQGVVPLLCNAGVKSLLAIICAGIVLYMNGGTSYLIGFAWGIGSLTVYGSFIIYIWKNCGLFSAIQDQKREAYKVGIILFITTLFVLCVIEKDNTVYFWDYSAYWKNTIDHSRLVFEDPLFMIKNMIYSLNYYEYNNLIPALMAFPIRICGISYTIYVLLTYVLFQLPAYITLIFILYKISRDCFKSKVRLEYIVFAVVALPTFFYPTLFGYIDVSGVLWQTLILLVVYTFDFGKFDRKKALLLSALMLLLVLTRRYFAYFGVGIVCGIMGKIITEAYVQNEKSKYIKAAFGNLILIGTVCLGILVIFFRPFLYRSLINNYQNAYSAYNMGDLIFNYKQIIIWFGAIIIGCAISGAILGLFVSGLRSYLIAIWISVVVSTFLIFQILTMGMHQYYIISPQIILAIGILLIWMVEYKRNVICGITVLGISINFLASFNVLCKDEYSILFSVRRYSPKVRGDMRELLLMANDAKRAAGEHGKVVITASSDLLNSDTLRNLYLPYESNYFPNLSYFCDVDLRDGFPVDIINAEIVIASSPTQYHLSPEGQRVIGFFNEEFFNGGRLSRDFEVIGEYQLDHGVTTKMLKRITPFDSEDLRYIKEYFDQFYSEQEEIFSDRIMSMSDWKKENGKEI